MQHSWAKKPSGIVGGGERKWEKRLRAESDAGLQLEPRRERALLDQLRAAEDREKELTRKCDQMKRDLDEAMEKPTSRETSLQDELMAATAVANEYRQNVENLTERIRKTQLEVKQRAVRRMRLLLFRQMRGSEAGLLHRWLNRVQAEQSRKLEQLWAQGSLHEAA